MEYSPRHMANLFEVTRETVRAWSIEFKAYLSDRANPGDGRYRKFSEDDVRVFAVIAELRNAGLGFEDIHAALANGQRADPPPDADALTGDSQQKQVKALQNEVRSLRQQLSEVRTEHDKQQGIVDFLRSELQKAQDEIRQLNREIGRMENKLDDDD